MQNDLVLFLLITKLALNIKVLDIKKIILFFENFYKKLKLFKKLKINKSL